jgi:hypothetical protein
MNSFEKDGEGISTNVRYESIGQGIGGGIG